MLLNTLNFEQGKQHLWEVYFPIFSNSAAESYYLFMEVYKEHSPSVSMCEKCLNYSKAIILIWTIKSIKSQ